MKTCWAVVEVNDLIHASSVMRANDSMADQSPLSINNVTLFDQYSDVKHTVFAINGLSYTDEYVQATAAKFAPPCSEKLAPPARSDEIDRKVKEKMAKWHPAFTNLPDLYNNIITKDQVARFDRSTCKVPEKYHHRITIKDPSFLKKAPIYHLSDEERKELRAQLDYMLDKNFIFESEYPTSSPVFFVRKKGIDGAVGGLRLACDYRNVNLASVRDGFPMPLASQLLDKLSGNEFFSTIDLIGGYHAIPVHRDSIRYTAISTAFGQYSYRVLNFGFADAPQTFSKYVSGHVLKGLEDCCIAYIDDVCVFGKTFEEHTERLHKVLTRLQKARLPVSLLKAEFPDTSSEPLGELHAGRHGTRVVIVGLQQPERKCVGSRSPTSEGILSRSRTSGETGEMVCRQTEAPPTLWRRNRPQAFYF